MILPNKRLFVPVAVIMLEIIVVLIIVAISFWKRLL